MKLLRKTPKVKATMEKWRTTVGVKQIGEPGWEVDTHLPRHDRAILSLITLGYDVDNENDVALVTGKLYRYRLYYIVDNKLPPMVAHALSGYILSHDFVSSDYRSSLRTLHREVIPTYFKETVSGHQDDGLTPVQAVIAAYRPQLASRFHLANELGQTADWNIVENETIDLRMAQEIFDMDLRDRRIDSCSPNIPRACYTRYNKYDLLLMGFTKEEIIHVATNYPYALWINQASGYSADDLRRIDVDPKKFVSFYFAFCTSIKNKLSMDQILGAIYAGVNNLNDFKRAGKTLGFKTSQIAPNFEAVFAEWVKQEAKRNNP